MFTQLNLLRKEQIDKEEHIAFRARRFEYMVVNAFAFFLRPESRMVAANLAITTQSKTIGSFSNFKNESSTFKRNVVEWQYVDIDNPDYPTEATHEAVLVNAIWRHPIFMLNNLKEDFNFEPIIVKGAKTSTKKKDEATVKK
ncbi:hypothetical protein GCM10023116_21250 [Kistimonas scapharcae]|uniref:Uncharacterized protein n=1 Tax=Kistimonas scapharcae TaxID=1036133 RepID=A0ABP8V376_9GAMM